MLMNLLKMLKYKHILILLIFCSFSIGASDLIRITNSKDKNPTAFQSIKYENIIVDDIELEYYLWIKEEGGNPKKLKESNKYIKPRKDGYIAGQYPPVDKRSLKSELTNLKPNTKYIIFIASEDGVDNPEASATQHTYSSPVNYKISDSGINYISLNINKNQEENNFIRIKITDKDENIDYYLGEDLETLYKIEYSINIDNIEKTLKVKDKIKPNTKYEISIASRNNLLIFSNEISKTIKTKKLKKPESFSVEYKKGSFYYRVSNNNQEDVSTILKVSLDGTEILDDIELEFNKDTKLDYDLNNKDGQYTFVCFNKYQDSESKYITHEIYYNNIFSDQDILYSSGKIYIPKTSIPINNSLAKGDRFNSNYSLDGIRAKKYANQFKEIILNKKNYQKYLEHRERKGSQNDFIFIKKYSEKNKTFNIPKMSISDLYKQNKDDFVAYKLTSSNKEAKVEYLYNIVYGLVSASIEEGYNYHSKEGKIDTLPPILIKQSNSAILREGDFLDISIPEDLPIQWDKNLGKNNNYSETYTFTLLPQEKLKKGVSINKVARLQLNKDLPLKEGIIIDDLPFVIKEAKPFSIALKLDIKADNYSVEKPIIINPGLKVGDFYFEEISNTEIYNEGISNDPTPSIQEIVLNDNIGILNKDDKVELNLLSDQIFFDITSKPITDLKIEEFSEDKLILTNFNNQGKQKRFFIKDLPIKYKDITNERIGDYSIEMKIKSANYNQETVVKNGIFHIAQLNPIYIDSKLDQYSIKNYKLDSPYKFTKKDTLNILWEADLSQKGLKVIKESILKSYPNLKASNDKGSKKLSFILNKGSKSFSVSKIPVIKRTDTENWNGLENLYFNITGKDKSVTNLFKIYYGEIVISVPEYKRYSSEKTKLLDLPFVNIKQNGYPILSKGDIISFVIDKEIPVEWSRKQNSEKNDFIITLDKKNKKKIILEAKKDFHDIESINIDALKIDILNTTSFNFSFKANIDKKTTILRNGKTELVDFFMRPYNVRFNKDGIDIGKPKISFVTKEKSQQEYSGIILGRQYNRMLTLSIASQNKAILRKNDFINISILDTSATWSTNKINEFITITGSGKEKIQLFKQDKNILSFKILNNLDDLDSILISGLSTSKIERNQLAESSLKIAIEYQIDKNIKETLKAQEIQDIYIDFASNDVMYQSDIIDDKIVPSIKNFNPTVKTFWKDEDFLIAYLPKQSIANWKSGMAKYKINTNKRNFIKIDLYDQVNKNLTLYPLFIQTKSNSEITEGYFNIEYIMDNFISYNEIDMNAPNYYNPSALINNKLFSNIKFDLQENKAIFAWTRNNKFKIPNIEINQNSVSHLSSNDTIQLIIEKPASSPPSLYFSADLNKIKNLKHENIELELLNKKQNYIETLSFIVKKITNKNKPIIIKGIEMKLDKGILAVKQEIPIGLKINPSKKTKAIAHFKSNNYIKLGKPKVTFNTKKISFPVGVLETPLITIDDSESQILTNIKPIRLRISKTNNFSDSTLYWVNINKNNSNYTNKGNVLYKDMKNSGKKIIDIASHKFSGFNTFTSVSSNGEKIYGEISFDGGANYFPLLTDGIDKKPLAYIDRPKDISFSENAVNDLDSRIQYLPDLIISENNKVSTIKKNTTLIVELNDEIFKWDKVKSWKVLSSIENKNTNDIQLNFKSNNILEINFNRNLDKKEVIRVAGLKVFRKKTFNSETVKLFFKVNNKIILDSNFRIDQSDLDITLEDNNKIFFNGDTLMYSMRDYNNQTNNYYPDIYFSESNKSKNSTLKKQDTILVDFPFSLDFNFLEEKVNSEDNKLFKVEETEKSNQIKILILKDASKNELIYLPKLKFDYPIEKKIIDPSSISFTIFNKYQKFSSKNTENSSKKIVLASGQPTLSFEESKEYFRNDRRRILPKIIIQEDKYLQHLKKGDSFSLIIKDSAPFTWSEDFKSLKISNKKISQNVKKENSKKISFMINENFKNLDEVMIDSLYIENFDKEFNESENPIMLEFENHYPNLTTNNNNAITGYNFYTNKLMGGSLAIRPVYLTWMDNVYTIMKSQDIIDVATLPPLTIYFKDIEDKEMIPKTFYLKLNTYDLSGSSKQVRTDEKYIYQWLGNASYSINNSLYKSEISTPFDKNQALIIKIQNPDRIDSLEVSGLQLTTAFQSKSFKDSNGAYDLDLYFVDPTIDTTYKSFKISHTTEVADDEAEESYAILEHTTKECRPYYEWYLADSTKSKSISLIIENKNNDKNKIHFIEKEPVILTNDGSKIKGILNDDRNKVTFKFNEDLTTETNISIDNIDLVLENKNSTRAIGWLKLEIITDDMGRQEIYTKKAIEVFGNSSNANNKTSGPDKTSKNHKQCECWIDGASPNLGVDAGLFYLDFKIKPGFKDDDLDKKRLKEMLAMYIDYSSNKIKKEYAVYEKGKVVIKNPKSKEWYNKRIAEVKGIMKIPAGGALLLQSYPSDYHLAMSLIHKLSEPNLRSEEKRFGQKYYDFYSQKEMDRVELGYNAKESIQQKWNKFIYWASSSNRTDSYKADSLLNKIMVDQGKDPRLAFAYKLATSDKEKTKYSDYDYIFNNYKISQEIEGDFISIKNDIRKYEDNSDEIYTLTRDFIEEMRSGKMKKYCKDNKIKYNKRDINQYKIDYENSLDENIQSNYSKYKGHPDPSQYKRPTELYIGTKQSINISYKKNNALFTYPITFLIKSSNMHHSKDKYGNISERQGYTVYYSSESNFYENYELYAGGKYLLVPQIEKEKNNKDTNFKFYSGLFVLSSLLKFSLNEE